VARVGEMPKKRAAETKRKMRMAIRPANGKKQRAWIASSLF
jgi:hypothetical protein